MNFQDFEQSIEIQILPVTTFSASKITHDTGGVGSVTCRPLLFDASQFFALSNYLEIIINIVMCFINNNFCM